MPLSSSRRLRWLAPVAVAGVVAAGVLVPTLAGASDTPGLPPRTAAALLEAVSQAEIAGLSGTVVSTSSLGLPALPASGGAGALSLPGLLSGTTTARVWQAGADRSRVAVDAPFAEYVVVRDGVQVWTYDSASSEVTRIALPVKQTSPRPQPSLTPADAVARVLALVEPSTRVSVGRTASVAGRDAYELVLDPRDPGTLVSAVRIAVDAETSTPLRLQVVAADQVEPAYEIAFTAVSFEVPDASLFAFEPPAGAEVVERGIPERGAAERDLARPDVDLSGLPVHVQGEGWTSVLQVSGSALPEQAKAVLDQLGTPVAGGRVVTSALVSLLVLDDGRVLVGAVPAQRLIDLASR